MRLNKEKVDSLETLQINEDSFAKCVDSENFKKMMVYYRFGKPIWAHKDYVLKKNKKKK